jgi:hypothetical protein
MLMTVLWKLSLLLSVGAMVFAFSVSLDALFREFWFGVAYLLAKFGGARFAETPSQLASARHESTTRRAPQPLDNDQDAA